MNNLTNKNRTIAVITLLAFMGIGVLGCKKECNKCTPKEPDTTEKISFNLTGKSQKVEFLIYKVTHDNKYYRESGSRGIEENLFLLLKEYCTSKNIAIENQPLSFVLYYDTLIPSIVTEEHIKGISIYEVKGRKIMHHLFIKDANSEFHEIENVKVRVMWITYNHIDYYLSNYVFPENPQNRSFFIINGKFADEVYKNLQKYYTPFRFEVKNGGKMPSNYDQPCHYNANCSTVPISITLPCVTTSPTGRPECSGTVGTCATQETAENLQQKSMKESTFFDLDLMHNFRDYFLP